MNMPASFATAEQISERVGAISWHDLLNVRMVGFACARAWVYLTFFHLTSFVLGGSGADASFVPLYSISTLVLAIVLFAGALFSKAFDRFLARPMFLLCGPLLMTAGTLLLIVDGIPANMPLALQVVIGVLTGVGSGLINLSWGDVYGAARSSKVAFEAPFAFLVAAVLYALLSALSPIFCTVVSALLPLASGCVLYVLERGSATDEPRRERRIDVRSFAFKICFSTTMFGLADGVIRTVFLGSNRITNDFLGIPQILAAAASVIIIAAIVLFARQQDYGKIYKPVVMIMSFFFLLMPVAIGSDFVIETIGLTGYGTFNVMIWIVLTETVHRYDVNAKVVFGFGWGAITLGVLLGTLVGSWVAATVSLTPQMVSLIALLAVIVVLFAYLFVLTDDDITSLTTEMPEATVKHAPFKTLIDDLAQEYGLSPKETEVLQLVARGRSMPRIQEELYISRGTATTHLRHIYQKMDIHDKQDLLDLIEERRAV